MSAWYDDEWLCRSNEVALHQVEIQGRTSPGLVPFVGAGMSTPYGLKGWRDLLLTASPPRLLRRIRSHLDNSKYERAAQMLLDELGSDGFQNMVATSAGDGNIEPFDFCRGTVSLLPLLATGPVVTTNFDRIIERAFAANGVPFQSVISGPRPDLIVDALHGNRRVLIKLHGDWQDRVGRTFAESDYEANYGEAQPEKKRELLAGAERLLFSGRSLLFIGASLGPDRTVQILQAVQREYAGIRHFAVMTLPESRKALEAKEKQLRTCGVQPLWYRAERAEQHASKVEALLARIVERVSVQTLDQPVSEKRRRRTAVPEPKRPSADAPKKHDAHFSRMVRLVEDGRLTFFLGSAIHWPTKLMAAEFYDELARIFECEALKEERFAVAQYIADRYGRDNLYAEIRKLFARTPLPARDTHELFAAWRHFRTHRGEPMPFPLILTTNYDDVLERRLEEVGLPYHLLSYQADGPHRGRFYHRHPDDTLQIIERPRNIRELSDAFVVVKLNGGFDRQSRIPESYATTRLDYWDLAARIPEVLPTAIRMKVYANPLLFIGHGLAAADIESLVRFAHKEHPGPRSWAVVFKSEGIEYWRQCGVEILNLPVNLYANELAYRLSQNGPIPVTRGPGGTVAGIPARSRRSIKTVMS